MDEDGDADVTAYRRATRIALPASPIKGRSPSFSPEPVSAGAQDDRGGGDTTLVDEHGDGEVEEPNMQTPKQDNCKFIVAWFVSAVAVAHIAFNIANMPTRYPLLRLCTGATEDRQH